MSDDIYKLKNKLMEARNYNKDRNNLTFNHQYYREYLESSVKASLLDPKKNDNLVQLADYISNVNILSKNYVVAGDILQATQPL